MNTLKKGDYTRRDYVTNRKFTLSNSSSYVSVNDTELTAGTFYEESAPKTVNGFYKSPFFYSIKRQFYSEPYKDETVQTIHNRANVIQISQNVFEEKIKEGSVILTDSTSSSTFIDDSRGNLLLSGSDVHVGNVFYEFGCLIVTDTGSYKNVGLGEFELEFRSTYTKSELSFQVTIQPNEFNFSTNPTAIIGSASTFDRPRYSYTLSDFSQSYDERITQYSIIPEFFGLDPSGSVDTPLSPYITTIGFYNDIGDLLACAKLAEPTPVPKSFPITIRAVIDI